MSHPDRPPSSDESGYGRSPDGLTIEKSLGGLTIARRWSRPAGYAILLWIAVWTGLVAFFTSLGHQPADGLARALYLPAIAMGYVALTRFLNRTVIEVGTSEMTVRHLPLPWPGNKRFPTQDIMGLHEEIRKIHAKGHTVDECRLLVVRRNGKKAILLKGLEMTDMQMSRIAAAIGDCLGVPLTAGRG